MVHMDKTWLSFRATHSTMRGIAVVTGLVFFVLCVLITLFLSLSSNGGANEHERMHRVKREPLEPVHDFGNVDQTKDINNVVQEVSRIQKLTNSLPVYSEGDSYIPEQNQLPPKVTVDEKNGDSTRDSLDKTYPEWVYDVIQSDPQDEKVDHPEGDGLAKIQFQNGNEGANSRRQAKESDASAAEKRKIYFDKIKQFLGEDKPHYKEENHEAEDDYYYYDTDDENTTERPDSRTTEDEDDHVHDNVGNNDNYDYYDDDDSEKQNADSKTLHDDGGSSDYSHPPNIADDGTHYTDYHGAVRPNDPKSSQIYGGDNEYVAEEDDDMNYNHGAEESNQVYYDSPGEGGGYNTDEYDGGDDDDDDDEDSMVSGPDYVDMGEDHLSYDDRDESMVVQAQNPRRKMKARHRSPRRRGGRSRFLGGSYRRPRPKQVMGKMGMFPRVRPAQPAPVQQVRPQQLLQPVQQVLRPIAVAHPLAPQLLQQPRLRPVMQPVMQPIPQPVLQPIPQPLPRLVRQVLAPVQQIAQRPIHRLVPQQQLRQQPIPLPRPTSQHTNMAQPVHQVTQTFPRAPQKLQSVQSPLMSATSQQQLRMQEHIPTATQGQLTQQHRGMHVPPPQINVIVNPPAPTKAPVTENNDMDSNHGNTLSNSIYADIMRRITNKLNQQSKMDERNQMTRNMQAKPGNIINQQPNRMNNNMQTMQRQPNVRMHHQPRPMQPNDMIVQEQPNLFLSQQTRPSVTHNKYVLPSLASIYKQPDMMSESAGNKGSGDNFFTLLASAIMSNAGGGSAASPRLPSPPFPGVPTPLGTVVLPANFLGNSQNYRKEQSPVTAYVLPAVLGSNPSASNFHIPQLESPQRPQTVVKQPIVVSAPSAPSSNLLSQQVLLNSYTKLYEDLISSINPSSSILPSNNLQMLHLPAKSMRQGSNGLTAQLTPNMMTVMYAKENDAHGKDVRPRQVRHHSAFSPGDPTKPRNIRQGIAHGPGGHIPPHGPIQGRHPVNRPVSNFNKHSHPPIFPQRNMHWPRAHGNRPPHVNPAWRLHQQKNSVYNVRRN